MRTKDEILGELLSHTKLLDPQHLEIAEIAMIKTEVQIDIRDVLQFQLKEIDRSIQEIKPKP